MIQASWQNKRWYISPQAAKLLQNASIEKVLKVEQQEAKDGKNPTNTQGFEPQAISLPYSASKNVGVDPLQELEDLDKLLGERGPLYLAGRRLGPPVLILDSVEFNATTIKPNGAILAADFVLNFIEDVGAVAAPAAAVETYYGQNELAADLPGLQQKNGVTSAYDIRPSAAAVAAMTSKQ